MDGSRIRSLRDKVAKLEHPILMAFGNPLLDVYVAASSADDDAENCCQSLLNKYNLKIDGAIELDRKEMDELMRDLPNELKKTAAGGCALNTVRILQELSGRKNCTSAAVYYGGLGNDFRADALSELVKAANIDARYAVHSSLPTGICVSIISGAYRSLAANLGAAAVYTLQNLNETQLPLDSVRIIYIEGFFAVHSLDVAKEVIKRAAAAAQGRKIIVAFNLNGTYVFEQHATAMCEMVGLANIIFGNVGEMIALAKSLELRYRDPADIPFILNNLKGVTVNASNFCSNDWLASDHSIIVMTQGGSKPATVVWGQGSHASCAPIEPRPPDSPIRDTTGAGDSLVAGFLFGLITGQDPETCLRWGCKVAAKVITNVGATLFAATPAAAADDKDLPDDFLR